MVLLKTSPMQCNDSSRAPDDDNCFSRRTDRTTYVDNVVVTDNSRTASRRHSQHYEATCRTFEVDVPVQRGISETVAVRLSLVPHYRSLCGYYVETSETLFRGGRARERNEDYWNDEQCIVGVWKDGERTNTATESEKLEKSIEICGGSGCSMNGGKRYVRRHKESPNQSIISGLGKHFENIYSCTEVAHNTHRQDYRLKVDRDDRDEILEEKSPFRNLGDIPVDENNADLMTEDEMATNEDSNAFSSIVASFISSYLFFGLFTKSKDCGVDAPNTN